MKEQQLLELAAILTTLEVVRRWHKTATGVRWDKNEFERALEYLAQDYLSTYLRQPRSGQ